MRSLYQYGLSIESRSGNGYRSLCLFELGIENAMVYFGEHIAWSNLRTFTDIYLDYFPTGFGVDVCPEKWQNFTGSQQLGTDIRRHGFLYYNRKNLRIISHLSLQCQDTRQKAGSKQHYQHKAALLFPD
jgi:hypothetical protein